MFTSDELQKLPEPIVKIFQAMGNSIMNDIIARILENDMITRQADWEIYRSIQLGESMDVIRAHIAEALNMSIDAIDYLFDDLIAEGYARDEAIYLQSGKDFISFEKNEPLQQMISGVKEQTLGTFKNITQTMGFATKVNGANQVLSVKDYLHSKLDKASMMKMNGTYDYNSLICETVKEMTKGNVVSVDYTSGVSNKIDVAVRRALMTGINQVTAKISEDNMDKLDTEFVETSYHSTARPTHQPWQGRVFYWNKKDPNAEIDVDGVHYKSFIKETEYGDVAGLCGANCRHTFYAFVPGVSVRNYTDEELDKMNAEENITKKYNGKEYTKYEATQKQRAFERAMRAKREEIDLYKKGGLPNDSDEVIGARSKYYELSRKYKDFSKKMGLDTDMARVYNDTLGGIGKGAHTPKK